MAAPTVIVEALAAGYGDSLLVTCKLRRGVWRMLVDTGPDECWPMLKARLAELPARGAGKRHIDLAVITHIDHDHIGGAGALFGDRELGLTFGDIWFNAPRMPASRGVAEGQSLATLLGAPETDLPWNAAWGGRHAVAPTDAGFMELPGDAGKPKLTLLSPTPASLAKLFKVWDRELAKLARPGPAPRASAAARGGPLDLDALARKVTAVDRAPANGSSIALLLEHRGVSLLLGADVHPTVLVPALKALAMQRGAALPLQVDAFKLSHHGSRANVTLDVLRAVQARHYIVSTNGAIFGHPDDEAIARVIVGGGAHPDVWFNYLGEQTQKWCNPDFQLAHGYSAHRPTSASPGVLLAIAANG